MINYQQACDTMISQQLRTNGVLNPLILDLIKRTPRELFVPQAYRDFAYANFVIPLAHSQQMWIPELEAQALQALAIQPHDDVLEVGTGTGYFTALLTQLANKITSVDIFSDFIQAASEHTWFKKYEPIDWRCANFSEGPAIDDKKTYDVIVISGALPHVPHRFFDVLNPKGRLFALLGTSAVIEAVLFTKEVEGLVQTRLTETWTPALIPLSPTSHFTF